MPHEKRSRNSPKLWLYKKKYLSLVPSTEVDYQLQPPFPTAHFSCGSHRPSLSNVLSPIHLCILGPNSSKHVLFSHRLIQSANQVDCLQIASFLLRPLNIIPQYQPQGCNSCPSPLHKSSVDPTNHPFLTSLLPLTTVFQAAKQQPFLVAHQSSSTVKQVIKR